MASTKHFAKRGWIGFIVVFILLAVIFSSCSGNGEEKGKIASTDTSAKSKMPKMSAKERLIKNNILERHTNWGTMHLLGKVKTRSENTKKASRDGKIVDMGTSVDSFDAKGNKVLTVQYVNGKVESKDSMMYDVNDNITATYSTRESGKMILMSESSYDSRGNETTFTIYNKGKKYSVDSYKYDSQDNLVEMRFGSKYLRLAKWVFKYDNNGLSIASEEFDSTGKPGSRTAGIRDENGNMVYSAWYNADGSIYGTDSMKYDDKGNRIVSAAYSADGSLKYKTTHKYDDKGNKTEYMSYKKDGSVDDEDFSYFYTYEYDATGNITRKTTSIVKAGKKVLTTITESVYTYY